MPHHGPAGSMGPQSPVTGGRVGAPTSGVAGSMYDFVRRHLCAHGGSCSRQGLQAAIQADPALNERLASGRGFNALLHNMRHSDDLDLEGETIRATARTFRRLGINPRSKRFGEAGHEP